MSCDCYTADLIIILHASLYNIYINNIKLWRLFLLHVLTQSDHSLFSICFNLFIGSLIQFSKFICKHLFHHLFQSCVSKIFFLNLLLFFFKVFFFFIQLFFFFKSSTISLFQYSLNQIFDILYMK